MRTGTKIVLAVMVAIVVILAYWAMVGIASPVDDFSDGEDDEPTAPTELTIAYAVVTASGGIYGDSLDVDGTISTVTVQVREYSDPDEGRVYENQKLLLFDMEICGKAWAKVTIAGVGFSQVWTSGEVPIIEISDVVAAEFTVESGRCFFTTEGGYTATVELWVSLDVSPTASLLATKTTSFEVNV